MGDVPTEVGAINRAAKLRTLEGIPPQRAATEQDISGSLSKFEDARNGTWWEVVGNDATTGSQVMERVFAVEAEERRDALLQQLAQDPVALQIASDAAFGPGKADTPLPSNQVYSFSFKAVLNQMAPFLEQYATEHALHYGETENERGPEDPNKLLGQIPTNGLTLPLF